MSVAPNDIDIYLAALPDDQRKALEDVRSTIRSVAPDAAESISYGVPTFKYRKRPLIYFGAAKKHCAIYAIDTEKHKQALKDYDTSKGTVRFSPDNPLPDALVAQLVTERMTEIEAGATGYRKK